MENDSTSSSNARKTILVVDNDRTAAKAELETLEKAGYEAIVTFDAEKAIEMVKNDPHLDLVLMDIQLGKNSDGVEAAKQMLTFRTIPIIFLASNSEQDMTEKVLGIGGISHYGCIPKSLGDFVLISSIKQAFEAEHNSQSDQYGYFY